MAKFDHLKKSMGDFYLKNKNLERKEIFRKFEGLGASKRTFNSWLERLQKNKTLERKTGSGRVAKKVNSKVIKAIKRKFNHRHGCSQRKVASEFNISQQYVSKILKESSDINCYKKIKRPLMNEEQKKLLRPKCKQLVEKYRGYKFIIDDESYFTLSNTTLPGNDRFYSNNIQMTPDHVKYKYQAKYESKVMVWIAISPSGISKPCFSQSGLAVNQEVYKNCLQTYLIPFIRKYHSTDLHVFWPDLASSHYANSVQDYLKSEKIEFVPKYMNPANAPKLRPIEDFWGILKQKVYEKGWSAKPIDQLEKNI
jgi:predicted transcriptional regulator